jgi:hypothetical protein
MRQCLGLLTLLALALAACKPEPPPPFDISIRVLTDGKPMAGAVITKAGRDGPTTGADGRVALKIVGQEGESVDLMVRCPSGYVSPKTPLSAGLRRISNGKAPEYTASCPPAKRTMVIAVRADQGPNLPVKIANTLVGQTDVNGAFTYMLALAPGESVDVTLMTEAFERIESERNPTKTVVMAPNDDVVTVYQKIAWKPPPRKYVYVPPLPTAIVSHQSHRPPHRGYY